MLSTKFALFISIMFSAVAGFAQNYQYVPGEYIVTMKKGQGTMAAASLARSTRAEGVKSISRTGRVFLIRQSVLERSGRSLRSILNHPSVKTVERNAIWYLRNQPNDPEFSKLWGLNNTGRVHRRQGIDINALNAWKTTRGNKSVVVGVIDTGIDYKHPDLKENMWINKKEAAGKAGVDDDGNGYVDDIYGYDFINQDNDPWDDHSHGTHVAGTIGAKGNNGVGVVGVNWDISMMALKIFNKQGRTTTAAIVEAIDYSTMMGVTVTNNSWGGGPRSPAMYDAIKRANDKGHLFVAAAGNSRNNNDKRPAYPSGYDLDNIIAVAAIDDQGRRASFSSYGATTVDIAAPGVNTLSTVPGGGYKAFSGTSMATPHVVGVIGLIYSLNPRLVRGNNPRVAFAVKKRLLESTRPLSSLDGVVLTGGLVDANAAVTGRRGQ